MEDETHNGGLGDPGPQNLNDLQSYLVNFNKEIGVHGEGSAFHHTVSQMINQASQPVFVSVPGKTINNVSLLYFQGNQPISNNLNNSLKVLPRFFSGLAPAENLF